MSITNEMIIADRKARKLSRTKYAELVGTTPTKIHNIEHGRALRDEEQRLFVEFLTSNPTPGSPGMENVLPFTGNDVPQPPPPPLDPVDAPASQPNAAPSSSNGNEAPVVLLSDDELDDEPGEDPPATTTFSLEARYDFELPGYHVSNSELTSFRRCHRQWYLAYYRELRLKQPQVFGARALGTRLHIALAAYYSSRRDDPWKVLEATLEEDQRILGEGTDIEALKKLEQEADLARIMLEGYLEWLRESGADEGLEIIGDEEVVEVAFINDPKPVTLVGKMDLRVRRTFDQARLFLDHKSVGSLREPLKTLHLDTQMLHYHLLEYLDLLSAGLPQEDAAREHTMGGLYNMLRKVKRTATANPPFFDRVEVRHNVHELRSYYMRVWGEVLDMLDKRAKLDAGQPHSMVVYPHPDRSCAWSCDFLAVCPLMDDGSDWEGLLAEHFERHDPHDHYYPYGEREVERQEL